MATLAPDTTETPTGWLGRYVEAWEPGAGAAIDDVEPATGRHIVSVAASTP